MGGKGGGQVTQMPPGQKNMEATIDFFFFTFYLSIQVIWKGGTSLVACENKEP